eukprot:SM000120S25703  [mRNA]  locus=s120:188501:192242:+ [translate_table: standard]
MRDVAEYAKSSRGACKECNGMVLKGALRLGRVSKGGEGFSTIKWFHPPCYFRSWTSDVVADVEKLTGFNALKAPDKTQLLGLAAARCKAGLEPSAKRRKVEGFTESEEAQEVSPVYGESKDDGKADTYDIERWEKKLASFQKSQLRSYYKGADLPKGWKSFDTVIFSELGRLKEDHRLRLQHLISTARSLRLLSDGKHGADAWALLYPSIPGQLKTFFDSGFKLVIFTNESNIDRWTKSRQKAIDSKLGRLEGFRSKMFVACGLSNTGDPSRKPGSGMWHIFQRHLNGGVQIDLNSSFFVGDAAGRASDHSAADRGFAEAVGLRFCQPEEIFLGDHKL